MTFLEALKTEDNKTTGWNGANGFKSTLNANLDLFGKIGTLRFADDKEILRLFKEAYQEDSILAIKNLFYIRDIKEGSGERRIFDIIITMLAKEEPETFSHIVRFIPYYGSYADLRKIIGNSELTDGQAQPAVKLFAYILTSDLKLHREGLEGISLAAKWAPSVGSKNPVHKLGIKRLTKQLDVSEKVYRITVSTLRKHLNLVESKLTEKRTNEIEYDKIPSQAFRKYTQAFYRNDEDRFTSFLDAVNSGEKTVNAGTIQTHQLVSDYIDSGWRWYDNAQQEVKPEVEAQWKNLPKLNNTSPNTLCVVDTSGSMSGTPMEVAVSLGIYLSEQTTGDFKDHFITFSEEPELLNLTGLTTLKDKVEKVMNTDWGMDTNLESVFDLVLNAAIKNNTPQEELPEFIFVLSDMQMNEGTTHNTDNSFFENIKNNFAEKGYKMPFLVWWNISEDYSGAMPVTEVEENTALVSGFSQTLFNTFFNLDLDNLENFTPKSIMLDILNSDRYAMIEEVLTNKK